MPEKVPVPVVNKGFYRFTDIIWEWHQALPNQEDVNPLKALLHYEALVQPDHPLRKPGMDGLELYVGVFPNHEGRLLFSLEQIQYIQYWLHAMGLTKEPIPIPGGDYLIQSADLEASSPVVYNNAEKLKRAVKDLDKQNKRLKNVTDTLGLRRIVFERARTLWTEKTGTWLSMDFEAWEWDHKLLTEFGWSLVRWEGGVEVSESGQCGTEVSENGHLIVKEHMQYTNGHWTPSAVGAREHFNFGQSEVLSLKDFKHRIKDLIQKAGETGPLILVFHDPSQDMKYLNELVGVQFTNLNLLLPDSPRNDGTYVLDTAELFAALEGSESNNKRGLEQVCRHLQIQVEYLHNAGNDAYYTLMAARSMASGEPCDAQRERRWPSRSSVTEPKVNFEPWEEDSDYSDTEGLFPTPDYPAVFDDGALDPEEE
ncbi:hypothetical protein NM688_g6478 [Phlebia brevispora]|uniref:Uncharacterized protein n=1 Tax=Phlebia brevispora TaxID=194682 RepID=A0ACC1SFL7_9APHY|nr:hypothetical protein NM688_g6478 [Phlebia brevispora]